MNPFYCAPAYGGIHPYLAAQLIAGDKKSSKRSSEAIGAYWLSSMLTGGACAPGFGGAAAPAGCHYPLLDIKEVKRLATNNWGAAAAEVKSIAADYKSYKARCSVPSNQMPEIDETRLTGNNANAYLNDATNLQNAQHLFSWYACKGRSAPYYGVPPAAGCYPGYPAAGCYPGYAGYTNPILLASLFM